MGTIGEKSNFITIVKLVNTPDSEGGHTSAYVPRVSVWAHERPLNATEALKAAQLTSVQLSVFEIWYREDLSVTDKILYKGRTINIIGFSDPDGSRAELYVSGSEVQS